MSFKPILLMAAGFAGVIAQADVVHVYEQRSLNDTTTILSDKTVDTNVKYTSVKAATVDGYIFTHWSISTTQEFENRTPWGCAYNYVEFVPYENTILTANYVPASLDSDGDGMADGYELYWYGNLAKNPNSDTDGDGYTFQQEITYGMNPHFYDEEVKAGVVHECSDKMLYNPYGYCSYTIRSEPEGELFETYTDWVRPGTVLTSPKCNRMTTTFAYWMKNGVQQRDEFGRAVNSFSFEMPEENVELVAVCESDADLREELYWYGAATSLNSDTDEDGYYLFEEIAMGTSPLFPDEHMKGVVWQQSEKLLYNPYSYQSYVVRSEPEGELFETITEWVRPGTAVATKKLDHQTSTFAQWLKNGVRQQDEFGRAVPQVSFAMPSNSVELVAETYADETTKEKIYWYGNTSVALDSDTDEDGYTFADEIAQGTSPLFPNETIKAGVVYNEAEGLEVNLQPYEQVVGAIIDGNYVEMFTSPTAGNAATSMTFGGAVAPYILDVNGDGMWDIVTVSGGNTTNVWFNVGSKGNPEFEAADGGHAGRVTLPGAFDAMIGLTLDIQPTDALSATTNGTALLVSDVDGRIWYYESGKLQHKVWGGSYAGFANGLMLAAVDWEDDGDLDCLCGTAEGKLILLRNPKVGRPTNVKAVAGADNVLLTWDPNAQSRIRGYKVYRSVADMDSFMSLISPYVSLPTYRDTPPVIQPYDYKVSSVSRFYIAGNSSPIVSESIATEAVRADLGTISFDWNNTACFADEEVEVRLSIDNSLHVAAAGAELLIKYDPAIMEIVNTKSSGLSEAMQYTWTTPSNGFCRVVATSGTIDAGCGTFISFIFRAVKTGVTTVELSSASFTSTADIPLGIRNPTISATITISENPHDDDPTVVAPYSLGDLDGDGHLTQLDIRLLAKLKNNARQLGRQNDPDKTLQAGDLNGNGMLDDADYNLLQQKLKALGVFKTKE